MSDLTFIEKRKLEQLLGMGSGYVLDFTNRTFEDFFADTVGLNIWDEKYNLGSGSKANRMRSFWSKEANYLVGKVLTGLLEYMPEPSKPEDKEVFQGCRAIAQRLLSSAPVPELSAIGPVGSGREFEILARSVHDAIEDNKPEAGLDRLHTYTVKFIRMLCEKHGLSVERDKPLHSLFGEYVKHLTQTGLIHSKMTERILKGSISVLDAFNEVRNEQSLAHDNTVLGYSESLLIFNNVASSIRFLRALEEELDLTNGAKAPADAINEDMPF